MKCPYRIFSQKKVTKENDVIETDTHEFFEDCEGEECPLYDYITEECVRAKSENNNQI